MGFLSGLVLIFGLGVTAEPGQVGLVLFKENDVEGSTEFLIQVQSAAAESIARITSSTHACHQYEDQVSEDLVLSKTFCQWHLTENGLEEMKSITLDNRLAIPFGNPFLGHVVLTPDNELRFKGDLAERLMAFFEGKENTPLDCKKRAYRSRSRSGFTKVVKIPVCSLKLP